MLITQYDKWTSIEFIDDQEAEPYVEPLLVGLQHHLWRRRLFVRDLQRVRMLRTAELEYSYPAKYHWRERRIAVGLSESRLDRTVESCQKISRRILIEGNHTPDSYVAAQQPLDFAYYLQNPNEIPISILHHPHKESSAK